MTTLDNNCYAIKKDDNLKLASALKEGWHNTEKYGEVYVSPGGTAWVVRIVGTTLKSVSVSITAQGIVKTPATERVKLALAERKRYQVKVSARKQAGLPLSEVELMVGGVR